LVLQELQQLGVPSANRRVEDHFHGGLLVLMEVAKLNQFSTKTFEDLKTLFADMSGACMPRIMRIAQ
jgi:hypothetical protein